jgi:PAS domain S-box-containing protein
MGIIERIKRFFAPEVQAGNVENNLKLYRIYSILGAFFGFIIIFGIYRWPTDRPDFIVAFSLPSLFLVLTLFSAIERFKKAFVWALHVAYFITTAFGVYMIMIENGSLEIFFSFYLVYVTVCVVLKNYWFVAVYTFLTLITLAIVLSLIEGEKVDTMMALGSIIGTGMFTFTMLWYRRKIRNQFVYEAMLLEKNQTLLTALFNQTYDAILLVDYYSRKVDECNDVAVKLFECEDQSEIIGFSRDKFQVKKLTDDDLEMCRRDLSRSGTWKDVREYETKSGKRFWAEEVITPLAVERRDCFVLRIVDITHRIEAEQALAANEQRLTLILENIDESVYNIAITEDGSRKFQYVSAQIRNMFGFTEEEYSKASAQELVKFYHPDDVHKVKEASEYIQEHKKSVSLIYRFKAKNKSDYVWLEEKVFPQYDENGRHIANFGVLRDVTERIASEILLKESEEQFRNLFEHAPSGMAITALDGKFIRVNRAFTDVIGYSAEELLNKVSFSDISFDHDLSDIPALEQQLLNAKITEFNLEKRFIHKQGHQVEVLQQVSLERNEAGEPLHIIVQITDLTERLSSENALRDSEERFRSLAVNAPNNIAILNTEGLVIYTNRVAQTLRFDEVIGKSVLTFVPENQHTEMTERITAAAKTGDVSEFEMAFTSDPRRWWSNQLGVIRNDAGDVEQLILIGSDITERKQTQNLLRGTADAAHELFVSQDVSESIPNALSIIGKAAQVDRTYIFEIEGGDHTNAVANQRYEWSAKHDKVNRENPDLQDISIRTFPGLFDRLKVNEVFTGVLSEVDDVMQQQFNSLNIVSIIIIPIFIKEELWGFIGFDDCRYERTWSEDEQSTLLSLGTNIGSTIQSRTYQQELKRSQESFKNLFEHSPDGIIIHIEGIIEYANPSAITLLGRERIDELTGKYLGDLFSDEAREVIERRMSLLRRGETPLFEEILGVLPTGEKLELGIKSVMTEYNGEKAIQVILSDMRQQKELASEQMRAQLAEEANRQLEDEIDKHKNTQKILQKTQEFIRSIIDSSLDMIMATDNDNKITEFNQAALQQFGFTIEEIRGIGPKLLYLNKEDYERVREDLAEHGSFSGEIENVKKNGERFTSYLAASLIRNEDGETEGVMGVSRDITELKRAEEELIRSEERYRDLFEYMFDAVLLLDANGNIKDLNKAAKAMLEVEDGEQINIKEIIYEEDKANYEVYFGKLVKEGFYTNYKGRIITKKGNVKHLDVTSNAIIQNGEFMGSRDVMRDITEANVAEQTIQEQSAKISSIFESGDHLFWTVSKNLELTSFNQKYGDTFEDMYGIIPELNILITDVSERIGQSSFWEDKYRLVLAGNPLQFEVNYKRMDGKSVHKEVFLNPIYGPDGEVVELSGIGNDITDTKLAERKIQEQAAKIQSIFESSSHIIWSVNHDKKLTSFNQNFSDNFFLMFDSRPELNQKISSLTSEPNSEYNKLWGRKYDTALHGRPQHFETSITDKNQQEHWQEIFLHPIYDIDRNVVEVSCIGHDVTYKKEADRKIKDQAAKISSIFESTSHMMIYTLDKNFNLTSFNKNFAKEIKELFGLEVEIGMNFMELVTPLVTKERFDITRKHYRAATMGKAQLFEGQLDGKDGKQVWVETFLNPIFLEMGKIREISCLAHVVTEKKESERQIKQSLKEKEVLLKEVHHRVKNNLQVISSILNLQSSYVKDQNTLDILKESQNRIKSMSFIHESLYHTENFSSIDFSDYILNLSKNLVHSYRVYNELVDLKLDIGKVVLNLDQAIPCGLIVNELVSNALKYAFPGGSEGDISIKLEEIDKMVFLHVADTGIGLPDGIDFRNTDSLGLQLVVTLVEQLEGEIELDTSNGTKYIINFEL